MFNKKEEYDYFKAFEKNAGYSLECAQIVKDAIENYKKDIKIFNIICRMTQNILRLFWVSGQNTAMSPTKDFTVI